MRVQNLAGGCARRGTWPSAGAKRLFLVLALVGSASMPAAAQGFSNSAGLNGFHPMPGRDEKPAPRETAPPGLPGSQGRSNSALAPEVAIDVPPTEALFSAINRGDLGAAREALNRGADLRGRNVLGMTPLDLSIDLARNDITFLLLSLRDQTEIAGQPAAKPAKAASAAPGKPGRRANKASPMRIAAGTKAAPSAPTAAVPPVRYASGPSNPVPEAGFLGFGSAATR